MQKELNIISLWMIIAPIGILFFLMALRFLNLRAKKKIESENLKALETAKIKLSKQNEMNVTETKVKKSPVMHEEELLV